MGTMKIALLCLPVFVASLASAAEPSPVAETLKKGFGLLEQGKFGDAAKSFQQADEQAGGSCGPCLLGLSRAYTGLHKPEKAADAAREAAGLLRTPDLIAQAWNQLGFALMSDTKPDLAGAEEAFRKATEAGAAGQVANIARYNLADVLWREKKYAESESAAREALNAAPAGPASLNARIVLCQARTDGAPVAPPEEVYAEAACPKEGLRIFENRAKAIPVEEVSPPEKLFGRPPEYARDVSKTGAVIVESIIDEEGCIQNLRVCKSVHPKLDLATLDAVRRWVFRPAELAGKPVKVYYTLTVNFTR
ncbi:MAG TPA: TonB family protein [Thermoanaerobaculia bacterium]|nr:TonB family protein [Thermoanaerobaculia bacterium]